MTVRNRASEKSFSRCPEGSVVSHMGVLAHVHLVATYTDCFFPLFPLQIDIHASLLYFRPFTLGGFCTEESLEKFAGIGMAQPFLPLANPIEQNHVKGSAARADAGDRNMKLMTKPREKPKQSATRPQPSAPKAKAVERVYFFGAGKAEGGVHQGSARRKRGQSRRNDARRAAGAPRFHHHHPVLQGLQRLGQKLPAD